MTRSGAVRPDLVHLDYEATLDCVHCGLCLPVCPTYQETGRESSSPRGRIYMLRGVAEGRLALDDAVAEEMYFCLACRACESSCPAGVRYGHLIDTARAEIDARGARPRLTRWLQRVALRGVVASQPVLRGLIGLARLYQRSGLQGLVRRSDLLRPLGALGRADALLPPLSEPFRAPVMIPAEGQRRGRVGMFNGCLMPEVFGPVNEATARVLARNGFEVEIPRGQRCCGALHLHSGDTRAAAKAARRNRSAFRLDLLDAVVANSAGCGASLKDSGDALGRKVRDVCEFLHAAGLRAPRAELRLRVAYDDPCHLLHGQRVSEAPRALLASIPGIDLFDLPGSSECCGAAGIYNLTHTKTSSALLERKLDAIRETAPDVVATGNPGCLLQLRSGIQSAGLDVRVAHPIELLWQAMTEA